jgi:2-octaprenyl-6-methoxyphenol hydroxylase
MPRRKTEAAPETANDRANPIIVAGTGPAGLIAALGLAGSGFSVALNGPPPRPDDRRTTALMMPALNFLDTIGLRRRIEDFGAPLRMMRIVDATGRLVRSPTVTFRAAEIGEDFFGVNLPNAELNRILAAAVEADARIRWTPSLVARWEIGEDAVRAELDDGSSLSGPLAVAADGRLSPAREAAGIRTTVHDWKQSALVVNFAHTRPHGFTSNEFHTETGPFTQVPLPGDRSSLVWVVRPEMASDLMALPDAELSRRIEDGMQSMLGRVAVEPGRQVYPLIATLAPSHARNRVALVGEAAHVFPPIGAQGLNLGIRDVADLVDAVGKHPDDPGSAAALSAYASRRRPDIFARTGAVNLLNQSLLSDFLPAQLARGTVLTALNAFSPLRALFMREGLQTGSGFRAFGSAVREQIRR